MPTSRGRLLMAVLLDAWPMWLALAGVILAYVLGKLVPANSPADAVRYSGMILQILGLSTVAHGLGEMRRLFGRPPLVQRIVGWFRRLISVFQAPKPISVRASAAGTGIVTGHASLRTSVGPGASLEDRVLALERNLNNVSEELRAANQALHTQLGDLRESIRSERQKRQSGDQDLGRRMEAVAIGGLNLETVGLFWLVLGVIATSVPAELVSLLR
jgi:hypothetical protein